MQFKISFVKNLLMLLTAFTLLNASCAPAPKSDFGIVFSANLDGNQDVFYMSSANPETMERLTYTPNESEKAIKVTRDGSRILFYVPGPTTDQITSSALKPPATYAHTYVLNLKTKKAEEVNDGAGLNPTMPQGWSIDSEQVVLSEISSRKIYLVNPDEKSAQEIAIPPSGVSEIFEFSYAPDGKRVFYTLNNKYAEPSFTSFLYDLETKTEAQLGDVKANCLHAVWSPTGNQVLLVCDLSTDGISPNYHVYIFDVTGEDAINAKGIADFPQCTMPAWSPDGKQVAMLCTQNGHSGVFLANSDGSGYKEIKFSANAPAHVWELAWSPSGQQLLFVAGKDRGSSYICVTNIDGSNLHTVTEQKGNYGNLSIIP